MLVTVPGMVMPVSFEHPLNAFNPIAVVEDERFTLVNAVQF